MSEIAATRFPVSGRVVPYSYDFWAGYLPDGGVGRSLCENVPQSAIVVHDPRYRYHAADTAGKAPRCLRITWATQRSHIVFMPDKRCPHRRNQWTRGIHSPAGYPFPGRATAASRSQRAGGSCPAHPGCECSRARVRGIDSSSRRFLRLLLHAFFLLVCHAPLGAVWWPAGCLIGHNDAY